MCSDVNMAAFMWRFLVVGISLTIIHVSGEYEYFKRNKSSDDCVMKIMGDTTVCEP